MILMLHIYNGLLLGLDILSSATTWVDVEIIMLRERSQTKKPNTVWDHLYMESKKLKQASEYKRAETDSQNREQTSCCQWEREGE